MIEAGCKDDGLGGAGAAAELPDGLGEKADSGSLGNFWRRAPTPGVGGGGAGKSDILQRLTHVEDFQAQSDRDVGINIPMQSKIIQHNSIQTNRAQGLRMPLVSLPGGERL